MSRSLLDKSEKTYAEEVFKVDHLRKKKEDLVARHSGVYSWWGFAYPWPIRSEARSTTNVIHNKNNIV